jgi:hypothetical protein
LAFSGVATKFFSCVNCEAPDWEIDLGISDNTGSDVDLILGILFIIVFGGIGFLFMLIIIRRVFYSKKRRTLLTFIIDNWIKLFVGVMNRKVPKRFTAVTFSIGSFIVKFLIAYKYITFKVAIILLFIVPICTFLFLLTLLLMSFYIASSYSYLGQKVLFGFIS